MIRISTCLRGVRHADARTICPDESLTRQFIANGKPSLAHFADMFRYRMMRQTGFCWVDTDILCLSKPAFGNDGFVFCRQADAVGTSLVNNAVLRLPPTSPALTELIAAAEAAIDVDQRWGAIGPFLLTPVLAKYDLTKHALDPHVCYPIEPEQFWKLFLPSYRDWAESAARGASFVHLWSEAIAWSGYDFWTCPPRWVLPVRSVRTARRARPLSPPRDRGRSPSIDGEADRQLEALRATRRDCL